MALKWSPFVGTPARAAVLVGCFYMVCWPVEVVGLLLKLLWLVLWSENSWDGSRLPVLSEGQHGERAAEKNDKERA